MPNYNYFGGRTPLISDEPAELQYTFGFPQVPELKNQWDVYRVQAQINSNQNQRQAADQELMHASELAKNHPATNAGIFFGNILGTAGAYALANSLPKWFAKKSTPQVNPMSPEAIGRVAEKITGRTPSQITSQAMNGYTPPLNYDFNLNFDNYKFNPQNNGVNTWQNKMFEKFSLPPTLDDYYYSKSTPVNNPFPKN